MYRLRSKQHNYTFFALCYTLCLFLALSFGLTFVKPQDKFVIAADTYWSNNQSSSVAYANSAYQITNGKDLSWFLRNSSASKAVLYCDIDMSAHVWDGPTVSSNKEIDGKGHTILGLRYKGTNNGLIASSSGGTFTFKNMSLHIEATTTVDGSTGGFVGSKTSGSTTLDSCSVYGTISNSNSCSSRYVGGLVGKCNSLTAARCFNYATISGSVSSYSIGGLVGYISLSTTFTLCANTASISGTANFMGGLAGYAYGLTLSNARCYNSGAITNNSTSGYAGGLVGYVSYPSNTTLSYVYNTGTITSSNYGGGLIGYASKSLTINNVYNSAKVNVPEPTAKKGTVVTDATVNSTPFVGKKKYTNYTSAIQIYNGGSDNPEDYKYYIKVSIDRKTKIFNDVSIIGNSGSSLDSNIYRVNPNTNNVTSSVNYSCIVKFVSSDGTTIRTITYPYIHDGYLDYDYSWTNHNEANIELDVDSQTSNGTALKWVACGYTTAPYTGNYYYSEAYTVLLIGARVITSNSGVTVIPLLNVGITTYGSNMYDNNSGFSKRSCDGNGKYTYSYSLPANVSYQSEDDIKTATFANFFSTNSQINGGYPYFPEMYW